VSRRRVDGEGLEGASGGSSKGDLDDPAECRPHSETASDPTTIGHGTAQSCGSGSAGLTVHPIAVCCGDREWEFAKTKMPLQTLSWRGVVLCRAV